MKPRWRMALHLAAGACWLTAFAVAVLYGASWWQWIFAVAALVTGAVTVLDWRDLFREPVRADTQHPRSAVFWWIVALYVFGAFFLALPSLRSETADAMNWVYMGFCLYGIQQYSCDADEWWQNRRPSARESA